MIICINLNIFKSDVTKHIRRMHWSETADSMVLKHFFKTFINQDKKRKENLREKFCVSTGLGGTA